MVLAGPKDFPLRQTSPEMDLGSPSIWADSTGRHIGLNKTVLRRTGHTCFVKMKTQYLKCFNHTTKTESNYFSFSPLYLMELVEESRMRPAEWGL